MANKEMEIKMENETVETMVKDVPAETLLGKVKKFCTGKTAKKIFTGVGIAAVAAAGAVVGVMFGKNRDEDYEAYTVEEIYEDNHDYVIPSDEEIANVTEA